MYFRKYKANEWALYSEKGYQVSGVFKGDRYNALIEAKAWISSWDWNMVEDDKDNK